MQYKMSYFKASKEKKSCKGKTDFRIKTERIYEIKDRLNNLRSLTFAKNNIEKNIKEHVLFKNYKERFERSLHLCSRLWPYVLDCDPRLF